MKINSECVTSALLRTPLLGTFIVKAIEIVSVLPLFAHTIKKKFLIISLKSCASLSLDGEQNFLVSIDKIQYCTIFKLLSSQA